MINGAKFWIYIFSFAGAFGYFEVTHDVTRYTKACVFSQIGKRTDLAVRFSTVGGESGSADTVRYANVYEFIKSSYNTLLRFLIVELTERIYTANY